MWFLPSSEPIMLYDIHYWCSFFSQGKQGTKYLAHPKIQRPKPCLLMFASLVTLDGFHLLLSSQLTAILTLEWSSGSMFHPLSQIYAKTPFCCIRTVANKVLICQRVVVFNQLWTNMAPTLNTAFSLPNVHAKWGIHCPLISSTPLLFHFTINQKEFVKFLLFSERTAEFGWSEHSASFVSIRPCLKSAYHL